jgi:hypothetical protein
MRDLLRRRQRRGPPIGAEHDVHDGLAARLDRDTVERRASVATRLDRERPDAVYLRLAGRTLIDERSARRRASRCVSDRRFLGIRERLVGGLTQALPSRYGHPQNGRKDEKYESPQSPHPFI